MNDAIGSFADLILLSLERGAIKKVVFSKPKDKAVKKAQLTVKALSRENVLQAETFYTDNKAKQVNYKTDNRDGIIDIITAFGQGNLITEEGDAEFRQNAKGHAVVLGLDVLQKKLNTQTSPKKINIVSANNREKQYILNGDEPFLQALEVSDKNGRIYDKKQSKFRQINRFLEQVRDILPYLPNEGVLNVCDLCCGKSYLSFAVYHYLHNVLGREVYLLGVDLKADVMLFCQKTADALGFGGMHFYCENINQTILPSSVHLVLSLHACDIATDIVLHKAVENNARVILSTPCCHHEMRQKYSGNGAEFITDYPMLKQKYCDLITDAVRLQYLKANGYKVTALELIDPDETPKNVLLRGIKKDCFDENERTKENAVYLDLKRRLVGDADVHF